jgi:hypothetical protein
MNDLRSGIHPAALDLVLDSAGNWAQKGQSQYSTPIEIAATLAADLPKHRPVLVDLTCGPGNLLAGCANKSTEKLLGMDVDPRGRRLVGTAHVTDNYPGTFEFFQGDLTALYEPMRQIDFRADLFVLNPPWSMAWHAGRLVGLGESAVPAVAKTFKALFSEGPSIDSTLATLLIALDRLTDVGEGLLIGYTSTLERLIFATDAIGAPLTKHIWKRVPLAKGPWGEDGMATALYFSAEHDTGPTADGQPPRFMPRANPYRVRGDTVSQWAALREKATSLLPQARSPYHLALTPSGTLRVRLGLFDTAVAKVDRDMAKIAARLRDLDGRNPMQVVMQRDERNFILGLLDGRHTEGSYPWTVDPALREAVKASVNAYNAIRAPLAPLPKIQRLGYLDEQDEILCVKDLTNEKWPWACPPFATVFHAGQVYPISTQSVRFTRTQTKPNLRGEEEELELSGQELAIYVKSNLSADHQGRRAEEGSCFMDSALRADNVMVGQQSGAEVIHFSLQDLVEHFEIPEVPDIATTDPERHQHFIDLLHQLEQLTN